MMSINYGGRLGGLIGFGEPFSLGTGSPPPRGAMNRSGRGVTAGVAARRASGSVAAALLTLVLAVTGCQEAARPTSPTPVAPSFGSDRVDNLVVVRDTPMTARTLPRATGGDGALRYSLTPEVPGLSFDAATRALSGTATTNGSYRMSYTVTDAAGATATLRFTITVTGAPNAVPSFDGQRVSDLTLRNQVEMTTLILPPATGGDGALRYSLTPEVPGLAFDAATRELSGTATTNGTYRMTYTVTDAAGATATLRFAITVTANAVPSFAGQRVRNLTLLNQVEMTTLTLPPATGGDGELSYSLGGYLAGLTFDPTTRQLSGTPNHSFGGGVVFTATITYTVTDADGDQAELRFQITIRKNTTPSFGSKTVDDLSLLQNTAMTRLRLPTATAGTNRERTLTYGLTPDVPGLSFNAGTRDLSGTPTAHGSYAMTYTVTDPDGDQATLEFTIAIEQDTTPSFGSETVESMALVADAEMTAVTLPAASGGNGTLTYSLMRERFRPRDGTPATLGGFPAGLSFNADTRVLSGTPTEDGGHDMVYTATDSQGDQATLEFSIGVAPQGSLSAPGRR